MSNPLDQLKILINSSTPIIVMETVEEQRALALARSVTTELELPLFEWNIADGLRRCTAPAAPISGNGHTKLGLAGDGSAVGAIIAQVATRPEGAPIINTTTPAGVLAHIETMTTEAVFVLKDFHRHMDDAVVVRSLRNVVQYFSCSRRALILTGPSFPLVPELEKEVEFLDLPLPDRETLHAIVEGTFTRICKSHTIKRTIDASGVKAVAANLSGLTEDEAERAVAQALVTRYSFGPEIATDVLEAKKEILRRSGMLEFVEPFAGMASIGGLENLKRWLSKRRGAWTDEAREAGLQPPRGVIILGVQGCGKSMCAQAIAAEWKLPLLRFDTAAIYDKFIGETEKRIQKVFRIAEQLAPAVLWIDELEKVFAGSGPDSASVDAGVSSRLLGSFLSWMQERKAPVFVVATCNNATVLPPELIRKGRFDELFFVDLPNVVERRAIFALHLRRRKQNPESFDLETLVTASHGYSGAEIESAMQSAMYASFADKKPMSTESLLEELHSTVPLSLTRAEDISELREWASTRAVPASLKDEKAEPAAVKV
jgi:ATPase family associated with various cellular activities (AAA)